MNADKFLANWDYDPRKQWVVSRSWEAPLIVASRDGADKMITDRVWAEIAQLITAAPQLLQALKLARTALISSKPIMAHYEEPCASHKAAFEAVEAALALAEPRP